MSTTTTTQTKSSGQEKPTKFVDHVKNYPTVQSGVSTLKSYPIGQKGVDTLTSYYSAYLSPFLSNFSGPYSYIAPYVLKADSLADSGLGKVDHTVPIITKDPEIIKSTLLDFAYSPFRLASDGKSYIINTYGQEYKKCGGDDAGPAISGSKALVTSSMVITGDVINYLSSFMRQTKAQGQDFAGKKYAQGQDFVGKKYEGGKELASNGYEYVNGKTEDAISYASDTAEKAKNLAYVKADEAKQEGEKVKKEVKAKANNAGAK